VYIVYAAAAFAAGAASGFLVALLTKIIDLADLNIKKNIKYIVLICISGAGAFNAALFHGFYRYYGEIAITEFITCFITVFFMLWLSVTDIKGFLLPNKILLIWLAARVPLMALTGVIEWSLVVPLYSIIGACIMGLLFLVMYYVSRRTLGGGDVKLSFVLGLSLTLTNIFNAVFYGLIICALFAVVCLIIKKLNKKDVIPLGPFLFAGTVIAYLV
jgi:Flp pilus assembly protein protease CpaA